MGAKDERRARKEARSSAGWEDGGVEGKAVDSIEVEGGTAPPPACEAPPFSSLIFSSSLSLFSNGDLTEGRYNTNILNMVYNGHREMGLVLAGRYFPQKD